MRGFFLANLSVGKEAEFFRDLADVQELLRVYYLFGEYEYLLELEADSVEDLARVMMDRIRHLPGVERTTSYVESGTGPFSPLHRTAAGVAPDTVPVLF